MFVMEIVRPKLIKTFQYIMIWLKINKNGNFGSKMVFFGPLRERVAGGFRTCNSSISKKQPLARQYKESARPG